MFHHRSFFMGIYARQIYGYYDCYRRTGKRYEIQVLSSLDAN